MMRLRQSLHSLGVLLFFVAGALGIVALSRSGALSLALPTSQLASPYASGSHLATRTSDNTVQLSGDYLWRFVYIWDGTKWEQRDLGQLLNLTRDNTAGSLSHADNRFIIAGAQRPVSVALSQLGATLPQYIAFWSANFQNNNWCGGCDETGNRGRWQVARIADISDRVAVAVSDIELALPSYLPEELRHPQKFFSGRKIRIHLEEPENLKELKAELENKATAGKRQLSVANKELVIQKQERTAAISSDAVEVEIPVDIDTGIYDLIISSPSQERIIRKSALEINGDTDTERARQHEETVRKTIIVRESPAVVSRTVINCDEHCGWETAITGNESGGLLIVGLHNPFLRNALMGSFSYSLDSGATWVKDSVDRFFFGEIPEDRFPPFLYSGDPSIVSNEEQFFLSSLGGPGGVLYRGCVWGAQCELETQFFGTTGTDRPLIAMDEETGTIYIASHNASFLRNDGHATSGTALYVLENGKEVLKIPIEQLTATEMNTLFLRSNPSVVPTAHLNDIKVGVDGNVYIAFVRDLPERRGGHETGVFRISKNPPDFQTRLLLRDEQNNPYHYAVRLSYRSHRTWIVDGGPYLAVDKSAGPHRGRIYALLSYPTMTLSDPSFEYANIGANTDIFLSYSDDRGETWSEPIVVNDDSGTADQYFPSIEVGKDGTVHVAFVDRRDTPGLAQFDIFYTLSRDGGRTFLPNIKVNNASIPLETGGRRWGDYVDLIHARSDGVTFIGYPCGNFPNSFGQYPALCIDKIDTSLIK